MRHDRLDDMTKGWFVGDFVPAAIQTKECEVAVKHYRSGDFEAEHYHSVVTEVTVIVSGEARMFERIWRAGDIVTIGPGEATSFLAVTDVTTVVVKLPSAPDDKHFVQAES